jgi:hypothetical protein
MQYVLQIKGLPFDKFRVNLQVTIPNSHRDGKL